MRKLILLALLLLHFGLSAMTGDSTRYLTDKDTIFLQIGLYQEKTFHHTLEKGQTLYSLAKFYGLHVYELFQYNPGLTEKNVKLGSEVTVPIPNVAIKRYKTEYFDPSTHVPICYKVQKGDNMFKLAKRLLRMPIDSLMKRNQMESPVLKVGQVLQLGWMSMEGIPKRVNRGPVGPGWHKSNAYRNRFYNSAQVKRVYEQTGAASWQKGKQQSALFALHRTAPLHSYIAVTNPMTRRTVYAKVMGRIPPSQYDNNVVVVLSSQVVSMLRAKDKRFYVQLKHFR